MQVTATEAKNRFCYVCAQAKTAPVIVEKDGRPDTVMVSYAEFQSMKLAATVVEKKTLEQKKKEFEEVYKDWFATEKADFEKNGLWCDGLVDWMNPPHATV